MKALTVQQPWANLIMHAGKDIENRKWPMQFRGPLVITASASSRRDEAMDAWTFYDHHIRKGAPWRSEDYAMWGKHTTQTGCALGLVDVVDCVSYHDSPWFQGPFGLVLANPRPLANPIPCKGQLGIWQLPESIAAKIKEELG